MPSRPYPTPSICGDLMASRLIMDSVYARGMTGEVTQGLPAGARVNSRASAGGNSGLGAGARSGRAVQKKRAAPMRTARFSCYLAGLESRPT